MRQEAYELDRLLERSEIPGPYILVGHSLGGLIARVFARQYPQPVAGVVLVDATHEDTQLFLNGKIVRMRALARDRIIPAVKTALTQDLLKRARLFTYSGPSSQKLLWVIASR